MNTRELGQWSRYKDWLQAGRQRAWSSSPSRGEIFLSSTSSRSVLGATQPPIQWVPGALSLRVKQPEREANHSHPTSAEIVDLYILSYIRLHGAVLN
jgi:hypothetical protein